MQNSVSYTPLRDALNVFQVKDHQDGDLRAKNAQGKGGHVNVRGKSQTLNPSEARLSHRLHAIDFIHASVRQSLRARGVSIPGGEDAAVQLVMQKAGFVGSQEGLKVSTLRQLVSMERDNFKSLFGAPPAVGAPPVVVQRESKASEQLRAEDFNPGAGEGGSAPDSEALPSRVQIHGAGAAHQDLPLAAQKEAIVVAYKGTFKLFAHQDQRLRELVDLVSKHDPEALRGPDASRFAAPSSDNRLHKAVAGLVLNESMPVSQVFGLHFTKAK